MGFKGFFIFCLTLLSTGLLNAQSNFKPAYIIKHSADTLYGEVDNRGDLIMGRTCKFKSQEGSIHEYSPNDITAFRFIDSKYYISREVNGEKVFLQYLIKGEVDLYYLRDQEGDHYFLDKEDKKLLEIPYEEKFEYINGKKYLYKSNKHIGVLNVYMQDAPNFQKRINGVKKLEHRNLIKLCRDYHNSVCDSEKCIIYQKKAVVKFNLEILGGVINHYNIETKEGKNHMTTGFLVSIGIPRANEKLYLKTGILYSQGLGINRNIGGEKFKKYRIPLDIAYLGPNTHTFRPSFSIGFFTSSYSVGLFTKLNKKTYIGIQNRFDFKSFKLLLVPSKLNDYSIMGSLLIEL